MVKKLSLGWGLIFCLLMNYSLAQENNPNNRESYRLNKDFLTRTAKDLGAISSAPFSWEKSDWLKFAFITSAGVIVYFVDKPLHDWVEENKTESSTDISNFVSYFGHGGVIVAGAGTGYLVGELTHSAEWRKTALLSLESWGASGLLVTLMKFLIGRERPYVEHKANSFHPFAFKSAYRSFPSGHATSAFAVAAVVAEQVESKVVDGMVYTLASLVSLSRVHDGEHWMSDVLIGSALGYLVGKKICRLHSKTSPSPLAFKVKFTCQGASFTCQYFF